MDKDRARHVVEVGVRAGPEVLVGRDELAPVR